MVMRNLPSRCCHDERGPPPLGHCARKWASRWAMDRQISLYGSGSLKLYFLSTFYWATAVCLVGWPPSPLWFGTRQCVTNTLLKGTVSKGLHDMVLNESYTITKKLYNSLQPHKDWFSCNVHKEFSFIPFESLYLDFLDKARIISMISFDYGCIKHISSP